MRLLLALDSRPSNQAAVGLLDVQRGCWDKLWVVPIAEPFKRRGFRGAHLDGDTMWVVNSAALYRLHIDIDRGVDIVSVHQRPEWALGQRAAADLHDVYWSASRERLFIANSFMDAVDELSEGGVLLKRHYLWDISPEIAELARSRRDSVADLVHINHIEERAGELLLTLGNCNGTRVGMVISFDDGRTLVRDVPFPHDGAFFGDKYYLSLSGASELAVYDASAPSELPSAAIKRIPIEIRQPGWRGSFQWVRGVAVTDHHVLCGVTQWRDSGPDQPQIPPRLVILERDSLAFVGDLFLPPIAGFPTPSIFTVRVADGHATRLDPTQWSPPPAPTPPATEVIATHRPNTWPIPSRSPATHAPCDDDAALSVRVSANEPLYLKSASGGFAAPPAESAFDAGALAAARQLRVECQPGGLEAQLWVIYYAGEARLGHDRAPLKPGTNLLTLRVPASAQSCRLAVRIHGDGELVLGPIELLGAAAS